MLTVLRVYADTSVFGGAFDVPFVTASQAFFDQVRNGQFHLIISTIGIQEITAAPQEVRDLFAEMLALAEVVAISEEAQRLRQAYLAAGIVGPASTVDALHVALATVAKCSMIVSWNFKHIVHYQKIPLYNAVNTLNGYAHLAIHSPLEVTP